MKPLMRAAFYLCLMVLFAILAGCAGHIPEPEIRTVEVSVPVDDPACARAAVARLGEAPAYPDNEAAILRAPNIYERAKLYLAGRKLRIAREAALTAALKACADRPGA